MNRTSNFLIALGIGVALSACVSPQVAVPADQNSPSLAASQADPNRIVCKSVQKTGTRLRSRECQTRRQWEEARRTARAWTEAMQARSAHSPHDNN